MDKTEVNHQTHLDGTIKLLTGDLGEEVTRAGLDNKFQNWIQDLKDANNPAFHDLVVDMQALKALFGSGDLNMDTVAEIMGRLGANTALAASFATGNTQSRVIKLGEVLTGVAKQLKSGAPAPDGSLPQDMSSHKPMGQL